MRQVLRDSAYRAELPNGHLCIAHLAPRQSAAFLPGDTLLLAFHPYDLSRARIILPAASVP